MKRLKLIISCIALICLNSCTKPDIVVGSATGNAVDDLGEFRISNFLFDADGFVWLVPSSDRYLFKTDGVNVIQYKHEPNETGSLSVDKVNDVALDKDNNVWIATQKGVDKYNHEQGNFRHIGIDDNNAYVISIAASNDGRVCIATRRYVLELDNEIGKFMRKIQTPFMTSHEPQLFFDGSNNLWAQFDNLILCYDKDYNIKYRKEFKNLGGNATYDGDRYVWIIENDEPWTINTSNLHESRAQDHIKNLSGIKTESIRCIRKNLMILKTDKENLLIDELLGSAINSEEAEGNNKVLLNCANNGALALAISPNGNLWSSDSDGGFHQHLLDESHIPSDKLYVDALVDGRIKRTTRNTNFSWLLSNKDLVSYNIKTGEFVDTFTDITKLSPGSMVSSSDNGYVLVCGAPRESVPFTLIKTDENGKMRLEKHIKTPYGGIAVLDRMGNIYSAGSGTKIMKVSHNGEIQEVANLFNDYACYPSFMKPIHDGTVIICYTDHCPVVYNPADNSVKVLDIPGLKQAYFYSVKEDKSGHIWIGSTDNGLYFYDPKDGYFSKVESFPESGVSSIAADSEGNVFVMGEYKNVYCFRGGNFKDCKHIWADYSDFPTERTLHRLPDGTVVLCGPDDYEWFSKDRIETTQELTAPVHVILTSGKKVLTCFSTLDYPDNEVTVKLDRNTNGFNMRLAVLDKASEFASYSYFYDINNFKTGARESFNNPQIPLYGVSKARNTVTFWISDNYLVTQTAPFKIHVKMNFLVWELLIPALVLFLLIVATILWIIIERKKREAANERVKREMTERLNMENIDFFANISHEFRTPLTLIHGAASTMKCEDEKAVSLIRRNADRMLKLVSQMLDFNKLDHGILKLNVKLEPVSDIIETVKSDFEIGAAIKGIQISMNLNGGPVMGWVDRDKLEKILYNLCSNAVKYTPPGGSVEITVEESGDHMLKVAVSDSGIGIPDDALEAVFDRFYRTKATKKAGGTGIGLYYTRALVNLHHGSIHAESIKEDEKTIGSRFVFNIPLGEAEYSEEEKADITDNHFSIDKKENLSEYVEDTSSDNANDNRPTVMVIDDDYEVVYYLKSLLSKSYKVNFRFDAMSGYKMIEEVNPDVIVCDMMMVEMDGIQLCRMVKENISMSHIPFIMLTAKSTMQDQIDSLASGADAYIVKPFNPEYLLALVKSMIDNRNRVRKMFNSSLSVPKSSKNTLSSQDNEFMEKMYDVMKSCLSNGELDIDSVAESLGVSRSKFYYKVKALTGQTPNEFFTTYKLNYSVELLKEGKYKIAAISDMLGFSSASHFASQFKKKFGVLPSQYTN